MQFMMQHQHPHLAKLHGMTLDYAAMQLYTVQEFVQLGSLFDILHNFSIEMDHSTELRLMADVASGLAALHTASPPIVHANLKSNNVLIDQFMRAKVSNYGLGSKALHQLRKNQLLCVAPELLPTAEEHQSGASVLGLENDDPPSASNNTSPANSPRRETGDDEDGPSFSAPALEFTAASDVYSLGFVFWEIVSQQEPFAEELRVHSRSVVVNMVKVHPLEFLPIAPAY